MGEIDVITALGRLLRSSPLRDAYAADPDKTLAGLGLSEQETRALLGIGSEQLEFQAEILLRKRFELVCRLIPETISNTGQQAWSLFERYAQRNWPNGELPEVNDARRFCDVLAKTNKSLVSARERNRVEFASGDSFLSIRLIANARVRDRQRSYLQVLFRGTGPAWRELLIYI